MKYFVFLVLMVAFSCGAKHSEKENWFKVLESENIQEIKKNFKPKYLHYTGKYNENSLQYVFRDGVMYSLRLSFKEQAFYKSAEFLVKKGIDINHMNDFGETVLDDYMKTAGGRGAKYLITLHHDHYEELKTGCEIINQKLEELLGFSYKAYCHRHFRRQAIMRGIDNGIRNKSVKFLKFWIHYNKGRFSLIEMYQKFTTRWLNKNLNDFISEKEMLNIFLANNMMNQIVNGKTFLDFYFDKSKENKIIIKEDTYLFLRKNGAKRACELLKTECQ